MGYKTYTCPIAKSCGGCEWLAVPYPIQLKRKQAQVEELLAEMVAQDGGTITLLSNCAGNGIIAAQGKFNDKAFKQQSKAGSWAAPWPSRCCGARCSRTTASSIGY